MAFMTNPGGGASTTYINYGADNLLSRTWGNEEWVYDFSEDPGGSWQNQNGASWDYGFGGGILTSGNAAAELNAFWLDSSLPSGDWLFMLELSLLVLAGDNSLCGIILLVDGTLASPNLDGLLLNVFYHNNVNGPGIATPTWDNYTTFGAVGGTPFVDSNALAWRRVFLIATYDQSAGNTYLGMHGGYNQSAGAGTTQLALRGAFDPTAIGLCIGSHAAANDTQFFIHRAKLISAPSSIVWPIPELIGR
jgi:hypothetical protein